MDRLRLYTVFDVKSERHFPPFTAINDAVADRRFCELLTERDSVLSKHPEDYRLFRVGEFDDETGFIEALATDKMVCVNQGLTMGRPHDVALAEEEGMKKFAAWLATRGLEAGSDGKVRQLDRGGM